jgi:outer membrane protein assembly factor BamB
MPRLRPLLQAQEALARRGLHARAFRRRGGWPPLATLAVCAWLGAHAPLSPAVGEDWPQFLGPRANGISGETGLLDAFPSGGPPVLWRQEVGTGYSAPSVRGRRLVLHHRQAGEEVVECFDAPTGRSLWRHAYASRFVDPYGYNNGPRATPLLTTNRCYTFGAEGKLLCLDLEHGRPLWQRDTQKDWRVPEPFFGVGSSPILEADKLIVMVGGQPNAGVVAFDAATGRTVWESVGKANWQGVVTTGWRVERPYTWTGEEKLASYATPVAATIHGRRHVFCLMRQGLVSLDPADGRVHFSFWFQSQVNESVNAMTPVVQDDLVLISAAYYRIGAALLRVRPDGTTVETVWRQPAQVPTTPQAVRQTPPLPLEIHWSTPVLHEGFLYAFSGRNEPDAQFNCVELATGKLKWSRDESWQRFRSQTPAVFGRGSCILAEGKLIALGEGGLLGLFRVNPEQPEELSRWQVPDLQYPCWTAPVLSGRKLYLRSEDRLLCLDFAAPGR